MTIRWISIVQAEVCFSSRADLSTLTGMIITIDGPAGSGKSTAARKLARRLGIAFLDTGATYRAATLKAMRDGVDLTDEDALAELASEMDLELRPDEGDLRVRLDGQDVTSEIRTGEVTDNVHYIAGSPKGRAVLTALQRRFGEALGDFVTEGRDQGSVVFPHADMKFFIIASPEVRARRRHEEMVSAGETASYESVLESIVQRDHRDQTRDVAPLVKPENAIEVDTSNNTIEQTAEQIYRLVEERQ